MRTDRLIAITAGVVLLLVWAAATAWAFFYVDGAKLPAEVPDYALKSEAILRAEWALAITLAVGIPLLLIARLLTGRFPDRISAQGAEWLSVGPDVIDAIDGLRTDSDAIESVVDDILDVVDEVVDGLADQDSRLQELEADG